MTKVPIPPGILPGVTEIELKVRGDDYTKVEVRSNGEPLINVQSATLSVDVGEMLKIELVVIDEFQANGSHTTKSVWFEVQDANFSIKALRLLEPIEQYTHLPKLISDNVGCSTSEARRILYQGGVKVDDVVVKDLDILTRDLKSATVQVGGRRSFTVDGFSLFILIDGESRDILNWCLNNLPRWPGLPDGESLDLIGGKSLHKLRLTAGLTDPKKRDLENREGVESIVLEPGDVSLIQPGPR